MYLVHRSKGIFSHFRHHEISQVIYKVQSMNRCIAYRNKGLNSLQIEGGECQLDAFPYWHDNGECASPILIPVVGGEVGSS